MACIVRPLVSFVGGCEWVSEGLITELSRKSESVRVCHVTATHRGVRAVHGQVQRDGDVDARNAHRRRVYLDWSTAEGLTRS